MEDQKENKPEKMFGFSAGILPDGKRTFLMNITGASLDELSILKELARQIRKRLNDAISKLPNFEVKYE